MTIVERKAELFDIIMQQDMLRHQMAHLESMTKQKIQELQEAMANGEAIVDTEQ